MRRVRNDVTTGLLAAVLVLPGLAACTGDDPTPAETVTQEETTGQEPAETSATDEEPADEDAAAPDADVTGPLDAAGAADRALVVLPGTVVELGQGNEGGRAVWEVGVLLDDGSGQEVYLDSETGETVRQVALELDDEQRTAPAITATDAIARGLDAVPGSVVELDLGTERSRVVWEVLVAADAGGRYEIYLDAATGEVVKQERDD